MNAIKALSYVLALAADELGVGGTTQLRIADLSGGRADNAIPREAQAVLLLDEQRTTLERVVARAGRSGGYRRAVRPVALSRPSLSAVERDGHPRPGRASLSRSRARRDTPGVVRGSSREATWHVTDLWSRRPGRTEFARSVRRRQPRYSDTERYPSMERVMEADVESRSRSW
jgi:hypothetical protein